MVFRRHLAMSIAFLRSSDIGSDVVLVVKVIPEAIAMASLSKLTSHWWTSTCKWDIVVCCGVGIGHGLLVSEVEGDRPQRCAY
jgi:hypothetical protein